VGSPTPEPASLQLVTSEPASAPPADEREPASLPAALLPSVRPPSRERYTAPSPTACSNEIELLDRADAALRSGNAADALAATQKHAERCATGTFVQERERIAIEALAKLGRTEPMFARARAFEERFPSSPHLRRIRSVVAAHRKE